MADPGGHPDPWEHGAPWEHLDPDQVDGIAHLDPHFHGFDNFENAVREGRASLEVEVAVEESARDEWVSDDDPHGYMFTDDDLIERVEQRFMSEDDFFSIHPMLQEVPILRFHAYILPGEFVPLQRGHMLNENAIIKQAIQSGFLIAVYGEEIDLAELVTIIMITQYSGMHEAEAKAVGRAMSKGRLKRVQKQMNSVEVGDVDTVRDNERVAVESCFLPQRLLALPRPQRLKMASLCSAIPLRRLDNTAAEVRASWLARTMREWVRKEDLASLLKKGVGPFAQFALRHFPLDEKCKRFMHYTTSTDLQLLLLCFLTKSSMRAVCASCGNPLFVGKSAAPISSHDSCSAVFVNPGDYLHDMVMVSEMRNSYCVGQTELSFSWFKGYGWRVLSCIGCNEHLGWEFTSPRFRPAKFYGVKRAAFVFDTADSSKTLREKMRLLLERP